MELSEWATEIEAKAQIEKEKSTYSFLDSLNTEKVCAYKSKKVPNVFFSKEDRFLAISTLAVHFSYVYSSAKNNNARTKLFHITNLNARLAFIDKEIALRTQSFAWNPEMLKRDFKIGDDTYVDELQEARKKVSKRLEVVESEFQAYYKDSKIPNISDEEIINNILKAFDEKFSKNDKFDCGLTPLEIASIRFYTGNGYKKLNPFFWFYENPTYEPIIRLAVNALKRLKPIRNIVVRGVNLPDFVLGQHKVGDIVTYHAFTSTSHGIKNAAFGKNHMFKIVSKTGKLINHMSRYDKEEVEVLFSPGAKFRVIKREKVQDSYKDKGFRIEFVLEELEQ